MRNIETVLNQIISILGVNGYGESEVAIELHQIVKDSYYTAPEVMLSKWTEAHAVLCFYLLSDDADLDDIIDIDLKAEILSVFSTAPKEDVLNSLKEKENNNK